MATITSYDDGNRLEDVLRMVTNITPSDTPFFSGIRKTRCANVVHQWPVDTLTTRGDNAITEGSTISYGNVTAPTRSSNVAQILAKTYSVSSTERAVKGAGVDDMFLYQKQKAMKELATDIERALQRGSLNSGTESATARRLAGALNYISTNVSGVASGTKLTESFFNGILELCWIAGGDPDEVYVNSFLKRVISSYTVSTTKFIDAEDKRLTVAVNTYDSDFGVQKIIKSRDQFNALAGCSMMVIQNSMFGVAFLEPVTDIPPSEVAQTLHGTNGVLRGELTLEVKAENSSAVVTGLNYGF